MNPRFNKGQLVMVKPVGIQSRSLRDNTLEEYTGKVGSVINYYWISPEAGKIFYLYSVRFPDINKEIILHEDEIRPAHK
jgi:hypothetical protein